MKKEISAMKHLYIYILFLLGSIDLCAQESHQSDATAEPHDTTFIQRLSFRTNAVYWLLTVPNIAIELDLTDSPYNKFTFNIEGKYNWNTRHTKLPSTVFNLWEVRPEFRKYWRTELRTSTDTHPASPKRVFSRYRERPKYWRAYYVGVYGNATGYTFKFGEEGIQGNAYGFGLSLGMGIPLYSFKRHYIDLELGGSIGLLFTEYNKFICDFNNNAYVNLPEKSREMHLVPYPLITDLHVSFVYRFGNSIKSKYKKTNYEKIQERTLRKERRRQEKAAKKAAMSTTADNLNAPPYPDATRLHIP